MQKNKTDDDYFMMMMMIIIFMILMMMMKTMTTGKKTIKSFYPTITCPSELVSDPGLVKPGVFVTEF